MPCLRGGTTMACKFSLRKKQTNTNEAVSKKRVRWRRCLGAHLDLNRRSDSEGTGAQHQLHTSKNCFISRFLSKSTRYLCDGGRYELRNSSPLLKGICREKFDLLGPRGDLGGLGCVLVRGGCLPPGLLERELDGNRLASLSHNV